MATCVNHPGVETNTPCANCGRPFCDACLVEFMGQRYCGPCRDLKLAEMQRPTGQFGEDGPRAGTGTVDVGGWLSAGWQIIQPDIGLFILATLLTSILSLFSCGIVFGPMVCGIFLMCCARMTHGRADFAQLWLGFRRFPNAFLVVLLTFLAMFAVEFTVGMMLGISVGLAGANREMAAGVNAVSNLISFGLDLVIAAIFLAPTLFALPLVAARNLDAISAFRASWAIFLRNPGGFLLAALVFEAVRHAGVIACCIGVLVTMPWALAAQIKAYSEYFSVEGWDRTL